MRGILPSIIKASKLFEGRYRVAEFLLANAQPVAVANLDVSLVPFTNFSSLTVDIQGFIPVTDGVGLWLQTSQDGVTYDTAAASYNWAMNGTTDGGAQVNDGNGSDTKIAITGTSKLVGNVATEGVNAQIIMQGRAGTTAWVKVHGTGYFVDNTATPAGIAFRFGGSREIAAAVKGIRLLFSAGNIASGVLKVYGRRA